MAHGWRQFGDLTWRVWGWFGYRLRMLRNRLGLFDHCCGMAWEWLGFGFSGVWGWSLGGAARPVGARGENRLERQGMGGPPAGPGAGHGMGNESLMACCIECYVQL